MHDFSRFRYQYLNRRCVSKAQCNSIPVEVQESSNVTAGNSKGCLKHKGSHVIFKDSCLPKCPVGYEANEKMYCQMCNEGRCQKECYGAEVKSMEDAEKLRGCTHINGSIEVVIKSENSKILRSVLEENLGSIEVIYGHLKVSRSSLTDLNCFKNLSVIYGSSTNETNEKFALMISENQNLQELWNWDAKKDLTVLGGKLFIHYNPKLCLQQISKLLNLINFKTNFTELEISSESNGDKFPCKTLKIDVSVTKRSHDYIEIHIPYSPNTFRYVLYYTKDSKKDVKMFDDVDQCSDNGWRTKDFSVDNEYSRIYGCVVNLTDLEPDTQYAFHVATYTINSIGATSDMRYASTFPTTPTVVTKLEAFSNTSSTVIVQWQPPKKSNGKLSEYVVTWYPLQEDKLFLLQRNYCEYPMDFTLESDKPLHDNPKKRADPQDCCIGVKNTEFDMKQNIDQSLSSFVKTHINDMLPKTPTSSNVGSYFSSYNYKNKFTLSKYLLNTNQMPANNKHFYHSYKNTKIKTNSKCTDTKKNLSNTIEEARLPANSPIFVIEKLLHFQSYVITVKACRKLHEEEDNLSEDLRCSNEEIAIVRTLKEELADEVNSKMVRHYLIGRTLFIKWEVPETPNGLIVAFEIQYQRRDSGASNYITECITHAKYEKGNRGYTIDGIPFGKYKFRIRAISLSGKGPFTNFLPFEVVNATLSFADAVFIILISFLIIFITVTFLSYIFRKKNTKIVIVDDNPNYHYNPDHYEVQREDVEFVHELGIGRFGTVFQGVLRPNNTICAIKTIPSDASEDYRNEFLGEATTMKSMSQAYHVVRLLGVVSSGNPPLLLMELMELGDLKTFLRSMRSSLSFGSGLMIQMASEIADAMTFMETNKFVHRDLAARNCMVSSTLTIKIGDFGMARDVYETDYYRKTNRGLLPIRWMAPESLQDGEFTSQSDVWSYGVVLWEVVTMAEQPFQGLGNDEVLQQVIAGRRLDVPSHCPAPLKPIIKSCWCTKSRERSSFMHIMSSLQFYHDDEFRRVAYYYSSEAAALRQNTWEYVDIQPLPGH